MLRLQNSEWVVNEVSGRYPAGMGKEDVHSPEACCGACAHAARVEANPELEPRTQRPPLTSAEGFTLRIQQRGAGEERRVEFLQPRVTVGRVQGNDLVLPASTVSKRTCAFFLQEGQLWVEDLRSTCGTYINGRNISRPTPLQQGDRVFVGDYILVPESR